MLTHHNVTLRAKGDQWHGFCPLPTHDGTRRSPSFSANIAKGIWHCFGCGAKGNALGFIARMEGYNLDDKAEFRKAALFTQKAFTVSEINTHRNAKRCPSM
ncbi:MAG: CHC2 zinc finger domain-containing protein [Chromatiales bacterium]